MELEGFIQECDALLKEGKAVAVGKKLATLTIASVERKWRLPLATICRRAGLIDLGLKLLSSLVHPQGRRADSEASPGEKAEYGVLLMKAGSVSEALRVLKPISPDKAPEVWLYKAFCQMAHWDYVAANDSLHAYLATSPSLYPSLITKVNLAAGLVVLGDGPAASSVLEETIAAARAHGYARIEANCLQIRGELHLATGDLAASRADLEVAAKVLDTDNTVDQLFLEKCRAVLEGLERRSIEPIDEFRRLAAQRGHWESLRDADRYALRVAFDETRFHHLLFGTPFASFRDLITRELGRPPARGSFVLGSGDRRLRLATGDAEGLKVERVNEPNLKVLSVLLRDFYRPLRLGALFSELFPEDRLDIFSSYNRVHQMIWRTRKWLRENEIPLAIEENAGEYRLRIEGGLAIEVELERKLLTSDEVWAHRLAARFPQKEFTAEAACAALQVSRPSFLRWAARAQEAGSLLRIFSGAPTYYRLK